MRQVSTLATTAQVKNTESESKNSNDVQLSDAKAAATDGEILLHRLASGLQTRLDEIHRTSRRLNFRMAAISLLVGRWLGVTR